MPNRQIDRSDWKSYLDNFSKSHEGMIVTVHTVDPFGQRTLVRSQPFVGLSLEEKGSDAGQIVLMTGTDPQNQDQHFITRPKAVWHKDAVTPYSDEVNTDTEELEITSSDAPPITLLSFDRRSDARLELNPNDGF